MDIPVTDPVPARYRGVWRRTLLAAPGLRDVATTVYWLQASRWHADIRIPAGRPDFSGVGSLDACDRGRLAWLARQQGFAGVTQVDPADLAAQPEICCWHRVVDYRPPASTPDAGCMMFAPERLVETGVHADYLEHWEKVPRTDRGVAVLQAADHGAACRGATCRGPTRFLLIAGDVVMHVRSRAMLWPDGLAPDFDMAALDDATLRQALDFEISFGMRTGTGWRILHSTLPWLEGQEIDVRIAPPADGSVLLTWNGVQSAWHIHEWQPPP